MADNEQRFGALHGRTPSAIAPSPAVRVRWQKKTYVFVNGAPAPRGMCRCRGVRRYVFVPVLQLSSQGGVRARICTLKSVLTIVPLIPRWLSLQAFPRPTGACPPAERPRRGNQRSAAALPETSTGVTSGSDGAAVAAWGKSWPCGGGESIESTEVYVEIPI